MDFVFSLSAERCVDGGEQMAKWNGALCDCVGEENNEIIIIIIW